MVSFWGNDMTLTAFRATARRYVPRFHVLEIGFFITLVVALALTS